MNLLLLSLMLPYHPSTDALCFQNADPELANVGIPILGNLGVEEGVCQGIAGVTAAFLENAEFHPEIKSPDIEESEHLIHRLVSLHRNDARSKISIPGAKNLHEFCEQNKRAFMREAILYNSEIAVSKILPVAYELFTIKDHALHDQEDQERLAAELESIAKTLESGRYPLMLYFKHVVMVTGMRLRTKASGESWIELNTYDSNHPDAEIIHVFPLEAKTGLPTLENHMIWNLL